jgi:hypothetical protein
MAGFDDIAREQRRTGLASEVWYFVAHNKKWWLLPIIVVLVMFDALGRLSGTAAAPFIYTLF